MDFIIMLLYIIAVFQIGLGSYFLYVLSRQEVKTKKFIYFMIIFALLYTVNVIIFLAPIKANIDEKNDCIAFYREFPHYGLGEDDYEFSFLKRCDKIFGDKIELLRESGRNLNKDMVMNWDFGDLP